MCFLFLTAVTGLVGGLINALLGIGSNLNPRPIAPVMPVDYNPVDLKKNFSLGLIYPNSFYYEQYNPKTGLKDPKSPHIMFISGTQNNPIIRKGVLFNAETQQTDVNGDNIIIMADQYGPQQMYYFRQYNAITGLKDRNASYYIAIGGPDDAPTYLYLRSYNPKDGSDDPYSCYLVFADRALGALVQISLGGEVPEMSPFNTFTYRQFDPATGADDPTSPHIEIFGGTTDMPIKRRAVLIDPQTGTPNPKSQYLLIKPDQYGPEKLYYFRTYNPVTGDVTNNTPYLLLISSGNNGIEYKFVQFINSTAGEDSMASKRVFVSETPFGPIGSASIIGGGGGVSQLDSNTYFYRRYDPKTGLNDSNSGYIFARKGGNNSVNYFVRQINPITGDVDRNSNYLMVSVNGMKSQKFYVLRYNSTSVILIGGTLKWPIVKFFRFYDPATGKDNPESQYLKMTDLPFKSENVKGPIIILPLNSPNAAVGNASGINPDTLAGTRKWYIISYESSIGIENWMADQAALSTVIII